MTRPKGSKNIVRYEKSCIFCGCVFTASRLGAKFCSPSHKSMYGEGIRRDLKAVKIAEVKNKIEELILEIEKSDQAEAKEFGDWLGVWLTTFSDKLRTAILNHDIKTLEEIHTKLSKVVKELIVIEKE